MRPRFPSVLAIAACCVLFIQPGALCETLSPAAAWDHAARSLAAVLLNVDAAGQPEVNGTAFIVENGPDGLFLLTNFHVISGGSGPVELFRKEKRVKIEFTRTDIAIQEGVVVGADPLADVALIKIDAAKTSDVQRSRLASLTALPLGDSGALVIGEELLALGHPLGNRNTPTFVRYAGLGPFTGDKIPMIRFIGSVSPGNSGGPLIRMNGEVVGINTSMLPTPAQVAFAIPSSIIRGLILPQLRRFDGKPHERMRYGSLGVELQNLSGDIMEVLGLPSRQGGIVTRVDPGAGGYFDGAGLRRGDVVLGVDGVREGTRGIDASTLFSPWNLQDPKSPSNAVRYDLIPEQLIAQDRASDPGATWRMALIPERKNLPSLSASEKPGTAKPPRFTDSRRSLLRMDVRQALEGVWVERDLNDVDAKTRAEHSDKFIRELYYRGSTGKLVRKTVMAMADIDQALADKPSKIIVVLSPDLRFTRHSRSRYFVVNMRPSQ